MSPPRSRRSNVRGGKGPAAPRLVPALPLPGGRVEMLVVHARCADRHVLEPTASLRSRARLWRTPSRRPSSSTTTSGHGSVGAASGCRNRAKRPRKLSPLLAGAERFNEDHEHGRGGRAAVQAHGRRITVLAGNEILHATSVGVRAHLLNSRLDACRSGLARGPAPPGAGDGQASQATPSPSRSRSCRSSPTTSTVPV